VGNEEHLAEPDNFHLHASRPEPVEALPRPVRQRDLIQHRAMVKAWQTYGHLGFDEVSGVIEAYLESVAKQRSAGR
jgi:hypothetical protein